MPARWPSQRPDGTLAVAVRYVVTQPEGREAMRRYIDEWPETHSETYALALEELSIPPHMVIGEPERVDVVFEAKAGSRHWKGVMVALVHDVPTEVGLELEGFADLISGRFRPANLSRETGS